MAGTRRAVQSAGHIAPISSLRIKEERYTVTWLPIIEEIPKWLAAVATEVWSPKPDLTDILSFPEVFGNPQLLDPYFQGTSAGQGDDSQS
jgi:hypothetical protein